jgi:hypothetical protein
VFAQDTGSAILGAVRADYFMGWGPRPAMWRAASSSRSLWAFLAQGFDRIGAASALMKKQEPQRFVSQ